MRQGLSRLERKYKLERKHKLTYFGQQAAHGNTAITFLEALWMNLKKQVLFNLCSIFIVVCNLRWLFAWTRIRCALTDKIKYSTRNNSTRPYSNFLTYAFKILQYIVTTCRKHILRFRPCCFAMSFPKLFRENFPF
jgi:hypothetical protein